MQTAFECWIGQDVVVHLGLAQSKVSLQGMLLQDRSDTLLMKTNAGSEIEVPKAKLLAIEEVSHSSPFDRHSLTTPSPSGSSMRTSKLNFKGEGPVGNGTQILVVSSELENRRILVSILENHGWNAICVPTVSDCSEALGGNNLGLVFCERRLTDGTYRDVLTIARALTRKVPLVVTSRTADWDEYLDVLHHGAFDLIAFPCEDSDVLKVVIQATNTFVFPFESVYGPRGNHPTNASR